ncbi:hypothetical protein PG993_006252 [Apiospora rasikravindrae]|uniref:Uncharacterized protein n=1 Tax=Apiospora rasikravindrae TaxID=990691 RepID=A0ABR1T566_9PEZI
MVLKGPEPQREPQREPKMRFSPPPSAQEFEPVGNSSVPATTAARSTHRNTDETFGSIMLQLCVMLALPAITLLALEVYSPTAKQYQGDHPLRATVVRNLVYWGNWVFLFYNIYMTFRPSLVRRRHLSGVY